MPRLSRARREEGIRQVQELRRRLREKDWDEVEVDTHTDTPIRVWRKPSHDKISPDRNPPPPGYKDAD